MFIYKCCWHGLQSQAERSRASRQISLSPDTYSSIGTQKYSNKVTPPHKHSLLHTNTPSKHICFFVTDYAILSLRMVDLICEILGNFTFVILPLFFSSSCWSVIYKSSLCSLGDDEIFISLSFPWPVSLWLSVSWVQPRSHTSSLSSSVDLISASDDVHRFSAQVEIWHYTSVDELQVYDCS